MLIRYDSIRTEEVVIPHNLLFAVWNFVDYMAGYAQQDAHEFLIAFLNSIDAQLRTSVVSDDSFSKVIEIAPQSSEIELVW